MKNNTIKDDIWYTIRGVETIFFSWKQRLKILFTGKIDIELSFDCKKRNKTETILANMKAFEHQNILKDRDNDK